jgi:hypothetical protein
MNTKKSYAEKLKDPRWQKKRLQVLNQDEFTCQSCYGTDVELHVHHIEYTQQNPWDEPLYNLITLCKDCHKEIAGKQIEFKEIGGAILKNLSPTHFIEIINLLTKCHNNGLNPFDLMVLGEIAETYTGEQFMAEHKKLKNE